MSDAAALPDADALRAAMVERVLADHGVAPWSAGVERWRDALAAVPRHHFLPARVYVPDGGRPALAPMHRDDDPARWLRLAYGEGGDREGFVVTQADDGDPVGPDGRGRAANSSASGPVIVAIMLAALDAQPGERVLEIGTGTGYNAALLAHRLGSRRVVSVEIDPVIADTARCALRAAGYGGVSVATGDGTQGCLAGAPYDRVIATVGVREIPPAWVAQTRPGGRIVLPLSGSDYDDGEIAAAERTVTDLHPWHLVGERGARFAIGQRVRDCYWRYRPDDDGRDALWLLDFVSGAWAKIEHPDKHAETFVVLQYGARRLFDEVARAHRWWLGHDRPGVERWRITVGPGGQRIILDGR